MIMLIYSVVGQANLMIRTVQIISCHCRQPGGAVILASENN